MENYDNIYFNYIIIYINLLFYFRLLNKLLISLYKFFNKGKKYLP